MRCCVRADLQRALVRLLCTLALFGTACSGAVAPARATSPTPSPICSPDTPDPGVCSPLRHPV